MKEVENIFDEGRILELICADYLSGA